MTTKYKIAIVEDEPAIAEMYRFKLEHSGYEARVALNGKTGLELVTSFRPQLILLDLMLPEVTGSQLLQNVRATDWGKDIKVIVLTNISNADAPAELNSLGVDHYVVKANYTPAQVVALVTEVLSSQSSTK
ncbi:MAG: response regulator [Candidatus Saccharimonadales bacterium]